MTRVLLTVNELVRARAAAERQARANDKVRLERERSSFADIRKDADERRLLAQFDRAHARFSQILGAAEPLAGGIAFMTMQKQRLVPLMKLLPRLSHQGEGLVFSLHLSRLSATLGTLSDPDRDGLRRSLQRAKAVESRGWQTGHFLSVSHVSELAKIVGDLYRERDERDFRKQVQDIGDQELFGQPDILGPW